MIYADVPYHHTTPYHPLAVVNAQVNGVDGYATHDLIIRHPTKPELLKVHERRDDQIVLSNGEKVRACSDSILTR